MKYSLFVPSKTFLLGEYAVLNGLPALVLNTAPRFELQISLSHCLSVSGIDALSPAGRFIHDHADYFKRYKLSFIDPHAGQGGFGASSAQFLMVYSLHKYGLEVAAHTAYAINELLDCYRKYSWQGQGIPPSGADLIGQLYGQVTWFNSETIQAKSLKWPFTDLQAVLIRTGHKLATHSHLAGLHAIPTQAFAAILANAQQALVQIKPQLFIQAINDYATQLKAIGLVAQHTADLLSTLQKQPYVLAAKGCGAMGADVVLALVSKSASPIFQSWLKQQQLTYFSAVHSHGLSSFN